MVKIRREEERIELKNRRVLKKCISTLFCELKRLKKSMFIQGESRALETTMSVTKKLHLCKNGPIKIELKIVSMQSETHCEMEKITNNIS